MNETVVSELAHLFAKEQAAVDKLKQTLERESLALSARELDTIKQCAQDKRQDLEALSTQVQTRLQFLSTQGIEVSESEFEQQMNALVSPNTPELLSQWNQLKQDFGALQQHNDKNGLIIQHSQARNRALMNILHGEINQPNLYGKGGSTTQQTSKQNLGEA